MRIYCLKCCKVVDPKTLEGDKPFEDTKVLLEQKHLMELSVGHEQFIQIGGIDENISDKTKYIRSLLKRHYPNVDIYRCKNCDNIVVVE